MTPAETKQLLSTIVDDLNAVATVAAGIDPALVPFLAIGRAVDSQIPGLAATVQSWIQGNPPTPAELDDHVAKLKVLSDPNLP
jgi:hypothetical protein